MFKTISLSGKNKQFHARKTTFNTKYKGIKRSKCVDIIIPITETEEYYTVNERVVHLHD